MKFLVVIGLLLIQHSASALATEFDARRVFKGEGRYHDGFAGKFSYLAELEIVPDQDGKKRIVLREIVEDGGSSLLFCLALQPSKLNHLFSGFKVLAPRSTVDCDKGIGEFTQVGWGHRVGEKGLLLNIGDHGGWSRTVIYMNESDGKLEATSSSVKDDDASVWFLMLEER